jgi:hypothetical protein
VLAASRTDSATAAQAAASSAAWRGSPLLSVEPTERDARRHQSGSKRRASCLAERRPFEGREFVWHPPTEYEDELGRTEYGPMVAVVVAGDEDGQRAARSLQRFLSAAAFAYSEPVDDGATGLGGDGESDGFHPFGSRAQRSHPYVRKAEAPAALILKEDKRLHLAVSYYREGLNASSPFYRCVAFRNVLDATYDVEHETETMRGTRRRKPTNRAAARDAFVDATAANIAEWYSMTSPRRVGLAICARRFATHSRTSVGRGSVRSTPTIPMSASG